MQGVLAGKADCAVDLMAPLGDNPCRLANANFRCGNLFDRICLQSHISNDTGSTHFTDDFRQIALNDLKL